MNVYPYFVHDGTHWNNVGPQQRGTCSIMYGIAIEYYAVANCFFFQCVLNNIEKVPFKLLNEKRWTPNLQY